MSDRLLAGRVQRALTDAGQCLQDQTRLPCTGARHHSIDTADHEAAAEIWERYKRGERGLFGRRLYTAQGQKAFEEIRRKYRADPEFRQTVEQYIHEFERLLEDVSRGDRGPAVR